LQEIDGQGRQTIADENLWFLDVGHAGASREEGAELSQAST
jgi:hypothetical protein